MNTNFSDLINNIFYLTIENIFELMNFEAAFQRISNQIKFNVFLYAAAYIKNNIFILNNIFLVKKFVCLLKVITLDILQNIALYGDLMGILHVKLIRNFQV